MTDNRYAPPGADVREPSVPKDSQLAWISILFAASSIAAVVIAETFLWGRIDLHPFEYTMWASVALLASSAAFGVAALIDARRTGTRKTALLKWVSAQSVLALLILAAFLLYIIFEPPLH